MDRLPLPTNEAEFVALMERIDVSLVAQQVPIPGRGMRAVLEAARLLGVVFQWPLTKPAPQRDVYTGEDLHIRIEEWVARRYGDRALVDFSPGRTMVWIRGAVWAIRLPQFWGTWELYASGTEPRAPGRSPVFTGGGIHRYNVIDAIEGCSDAMRLSLVAAELAAVQYASHIASLAFIALEPVRQRPFVGAAMSDLVSTVDHLTARRPHAGQAQWAAKMTAEKMIKAAIHSRGARPARTHDLRGLSKKALEIGVPDIPEGLLEMIDCDAGVRYGDVAVGPEQAIAAHYGSLQVVCLMAKWLDRPSM